MKNNKIILTPDRQVEVEGIIKAGETVLLPGTMWQHDGASGLTGGRWTWTIYNADADGGRPKGPLIILKEDYYQGKAPDAAYVAGERAFGSIMWPGCEFNGLLANIAGTADDHAIDEMLIIDDGTGKFIATTGTPETEVAQLKEAVTDPTADALKWMQWTGY